MLYLLSTPGLPRPGKDPRCMARFRGPMAAFLRLAQISSRKPEGPPTLLSTLMVLKPAQRHEIHTRSFRSLCLCNTFGWAHRTALKTWRQRKALASTPPWPRVAMASSLLPLQPTSDAPSVWLAISALFGLPAALWAYKVGKSIDREERSGD